MYDLRQIYHITCVLATLGLVCWVSYEYSLNEDETQIHIKQFHKTPDDIYPSTTICIDDPFVDKRLQEFHPRLTAGIYREFLSGSTKVAGNVDWNESGIEIDYDYVTYQLEEVVYKVDMTLIDNDQEEDDDISWLVRNNSLIREELVSGGLIKSYNTVTKIDTTVSARASFYKCFTLHMPYMPDINIDFLMININASALPSGNIKPENEEFWITFGYPNQLLQSYKKNKVIHDRKVSSTKCYRLNTHLGSMEVIRKRDKPAIRCNENWQNQDEDDQINIIKKIGCNPKHWNMRSDLPYCSNRTQYKSAAWNQFKRVSDSIPPCKSIDKLTQMTYEMDEMVKPNCTALPPYHNRLMLYIYFNRETTYKEIRLVRAFNLQSLIGNAGRKILHGKNYIYPINT